MRPSRFPLLFLATAISLFGDSLIGHSLFGQAPRLNQWSIIGPGGGGTTIAPTISPLDTSLVVEHCDMTGGYITHDNGASWRMFNLRGGISTFAFDPSNSKVIYAGNAALWRSADAGKTWSMMLPAPARHTVEHQLGDHADYALTSADPAYPGGDVTAIAVDRRQPQHIAVAFGKRGAPTVVVASLDGGTSWKRLATVPDRVVLLQASSEGVLALSGSVAYRLLPDGHVMQQGSFPGPVRSASAAEADGAVWIYATNRGGAVFLSKDDGRTWNNATPALGQSTGGFEAIATSAYHPQTAYVGFRNLQLGVGNQNRFNGIASTQNGGQTWKVVFRESTHGADNLKQTWIEGRATQDGTEIWFDSPYSLGVAPSDPSVVYATDLFRTYRSLDGGSNWTETNSAKVGDDRWRSRGLDVTTNYGVQFDPFDPNHMFIDDTDIGLFQSHDGGSSWIGSSSGAPDDWRNTTYWLAFDPAVRGRMWAAFSGVHDLPRPKMWRSQSPLKFTGGVGVSNDGGNHWKPSGTGMPSTSVTHILLDRRSLVGNRTLYACAFGRGVYKSTDDGKTWQLKNNGIRETEPFAWRITQSNDGALYLVLARRSEGNEFHTPGDGALYRSTDGAEHWQRMDLPTVVNGPTALEIDPTDERRLYLTAWGREGADADTGGGLFVSTDRGRTWQPLFSQSQHVYDVTIDPKHPEVLYLCGFDAAAYRSTDRGAHWSRISGYNFKWGHRVIIDPVHEGQIYITTYGGGVWHGPAAGDNSGQEDVVTNVPVAQ